MRRGRKLLVALCAVVAASCFAVAPLASADNGGTGSTTGLTVCSSMTNDPTAQGYCPPVLPPVCTGGTTAVTQSNGTVVCVPPTQCASGTTAQTDSNGNVTCVPPSTCTSGTTAQTDANGNVTCVPPTQCASGTTPQTGTNGATTCVPVTTCAAGTTAVTGAGGTVTCVPPTTCAAGTTATVDTNGNVTCVVTPTAPPTVTPPATTPPAGGTAPAVAGVAGAKHTQTTRPVSATKPRQGVAGAKHTQSAPEAVAPVHVSRSSGTLPFTGAELGIFVLVGLGLVGAGLLLHRTGREAKSRP